MRHFRHFRSRLASLLSFTSVFWKWVFRKKISKSFIMFASSSTTSENCQIFTVRTEKAALIGRVMARIAWRSTVKSSTATAATRALKRTATSWDTADESFRITQGNSTELRERNWAARSTWKNLSSVQFQAAMAFFKMHLMPKYTSWRIPIRWIHVFIAERGKNK